MTSIIDHQYKKIKHYIYKKKVKNDTKFSKKEFQKARGSQTPKKIQDDFNKIGTCLNGMKKDDISIENLEKVCLIICNTYKKNNNALGIGPLSDGLQIGKINHNRGYHVFYLYDPTREEFIDFLPFFLSHTKKTLVIYYSGRCTTIYKHHADDQAIVFNEGYITSNELNSILSKNAIPNLKLVLICDCFTGGSIWNLTYDKNSFPNFPTNVLSIYPIYNSTVPEDLQRAKKMHGIFTHYFCNITNEETDISSTHLSEKINPTLERFDLSMMCESTNFSLESKSIFD